MSSSFDSFDQLGGDSPVSSTHGFLGNDPGLSSQRLDSFSNFADSESVMDESPILASIHSADMFTSQSTLDTPPPPIYVSDGGFSTDTAELSSFSPEANGNGPTLPPMAEMQSEEGFALREWRRQNAIRLEEKEKREKELLSQIIDEADDYKIDFGRRRKISCETNKATNREKEKLFLGSQEKFQAEADKNYWKTIAEFIPNEVPTIEKRGKKNQEKKPSIAVIHGPKPGKPTELSRMRQILLKLKHNTPPHLKLSPPAPASGSGKDSKTDAAVPITTAAPPKAAVIETSLQPVAVA